MLSLFAPACSSSHTSPRDAADANDTGRRLTPQGDAERTLLSQAGSLPNDSPRKIGPATVVAEPPYGAASGQTCRSLKIQPEGATQAERRLVCNDGKSWFFVPNVFVGAAATE